MAVNNISKTYIPLKANVHRSTDLKVELYYSLGGANMFTYRNEARGYYLSVVPVTRDGIMESFTAFTGTKTCVKQVARKSVKAEKEAIAAAEKAKAELIKYILEHNGLELAGDEK